MTEHVATNQTILVVGGGISGMTAALEAAETGKNVVLVEKNPALGGRTSQLYRYFPKLCHPTCGLEINQRRLKNNPRIRVLTLAEVTGIDGSAGNYTASVKIPPRYVNENCTACGDCGTRGRDAWWTIRSTTTWASTRRPTCRTRWPTRSATCSIRRSSARADADKAKAACKYGAIDLDMKEETIQIKAGAVVWATGWKPYDAAKIQPYGYGRFKNVITSVEFERLADIHGPTGGKILRPVRRQGSEEHRLHPVRRFARRKPSASLLAHLLHGVAEADALRAREVSGRRQVDHLLHRHPRHRPLRGLLPEGAGRSLRSPSSSPRWPRSPKTRTATRCCMASNTEGYNRYATPHDLVVLAVGMEPSVKGVNIPGRNRRRFERLHRGRSGQRRHLRRRLRVERAGREPCGAERPRRPPCVRFRWLTE